MARKHLHAVGDGAAGPPQTPETIVEALNGSSRDVLAAMRQALARKLDAGEVSSNAIASAYKELRELDRLIRAEDDAVRAAEEKKRSRVGQRSFNASAI